LIAFVTLPATVGLIVLREPILRVLLQGGEFRPEDTRATAAVLATLSAGLFFFAVTRIVVPAFYAVKDTRLPVLAALADCGVFLAGCVLLVPRMGLPGIGLAASIAAAVNVTVLLAVLRRREGRLGGREILRSLVRMAGASLAMGFLLALADRALATSERHGLVAAFLLAALILAGTAVYWGAAHWLGAPEPAELARIARRRRK
jgi:putative peptidoglycan lipid II flippase